MRSRFRCHNPALWEQPKVIPRSLQRVIFRIVTDNLKLHYFKNKFRCYISIPRGLTLSNLHPFTISPPAAFWFGPEKLDWIPKFAFITRKKKRFEC